MSTQYKGENETGYRPHTLLGLALDAGCESFTDMANGHSNRPAPVGYCVRRGGRSILGRFGAEQACWPCAIAALLGDDNTSSVSGESGS